MSEAYKNIEQGIHQSIYCVAFIDFSYLKSNWTTEELMLFRQKELTSNKDFIIPIFCGISKEIVYQYDILNTISLWLFLGILLYLLYSSIFVL